MTIFVKIMNIKISIDKFLQRTEENINQMKTIITSAS